MGGGQMLFVTMEEFYAAAQAATRLTREQERECALRMAQGDTGARDALVQGYLHLVAAPIRRAPREIQTLQTVYTCLASLEEGVERFDFLQDGETFAHHLSWRMRQCLTRCIAER